MSVEGIIVTEEAAEEIRHIQSKEREEKPYLRISVIGGGCSGMSYKLDFENQSKDNDKIFKHLDVMLLVDPKSHLFLKGMTLEFSGGLNGRGFVFTNPNATKTCSCGISFSA